MFSLAIAIHEFGHFVAAIKLGLKVEAFSLGFGPVLWKKTHRGVEYRLSAIPLGGYVSIPEVDPEGTLALEGGKKAEPKAEIPAWKELVVAAAGPAMNVVLAVVLAVLLAVAPGARFGQVPAEIGGVIAGGPAERAGLMPGDKVLKVGERAISTWSEMQTEVQISGGNETLFAVERGGELLTIPVAAEPDAVTGAYFIRAYSVTNHAGAVAWMPSRHPLKQLEWDAMSIVRILEGLTSRREAKATSKALGGPIMIAEAIYGSFRRNVWDGVGFLRFLNVNLAVINLLPIPVLDGGLILFALIALVFRRKVPAVVVKYLSMAFMVVLMALMGVLILRDTWRSVRIHTYVQENRDSAN